MADDAIDAALMAAFAVPPPRPDPAFVQRVERAVRADRALREARTRAWRQFGAEALAIAAIALALAALWRAGEIAAGIATPAWAAIAMFGVWLVTTLRPLLHEE